MPYARSSTPLISLEAVALDTETTGLDAQTARIIEIAVLKVHGQRILGDEPYQTFVNPSVPIPTTSTRIHGLTDNEVRDAPGFVEIGAQLDRIIGQATVIGHDIGYDLTILGREYALAGQSWRVPRSLDVGHLARVAVPSLAEYSLDALCEWQQIPIERRHRAIPDAKAAAELYLRLIPLLRIRNIRTLAEAEAACMSLEHARLQRRYAGWIAPGREAAAADSTPILATLDSYPYRHRVREVMSTPPVTLDGSFALREAIAVLLEKRISSVLVSFADGRIGIVTERDLLRALHNQNQTVQSPARLEDIASLPLKTVPEEAFLYRAIGRIDTLGVRHLAVDNRRKEIVGIVTSKDLLRQRATAAIRLGDEIDNAADEASLGIAWAKVPCLVRSLLNENVDPENITQVISAEICALTARAAHIAEQQLSAAGKGTAPVNYAVMVLGSGGRGESTLSADQDNALVYARGEPGGPQDRWFEALGGIMADILDQIGVPYCRGGVMAKNAAFRHSIDNWKQQIDGWIGRAEALDLLNVDIFFDGVAVYGDLALADAILDYAYEQGFRKPYFAMRMSALARDLRPPLTVFGAFRKDKQGRVDLKKRALLPIFTAARSLAIKHGVRETSTASRLRTAGIRAAVAPENIDAIIDAHRVLLRTVLDQQLLDVERGLPVTNSVEIKRLSAAQRKEIHDALLAINLLSLILL